MAKDLPYFKFFCSEWNDGDVTLEDYKHQGLFINVCSYYWSNECDISLEKLYKRFRHSKEDIDYLFKVELIHKIEGFLCIKFLDEQKEERVQTSKKNSNAGKVSAERRRLAKLQQDSNKELTSVEITLNEKSTIKRREEKKREEEKREEEIENGSSENFPTKKSFLKWFNYIRENETGIPSDFNDMYPQQQTDLFTLKKSYTIEQFTKSLKNLCQDKWAKENNQIIPKHFLNLDNFAKYLNQESKGEKNEFEEMQEHIARKRKEEGMSI